MRYVVEDHFLRGIPQTILVGGLASRGLAGHWTAGATGRAGALGTAKFLRDAASRNASYHEIWWWEEPTETFGVLRIVPATRAAHSMNPNPPTWNPGQNVRRLLGSRVNDPNAASYAVSFAGMPADLARAVRSPAFLQGCARRTRELVAQETTLTDTLRPYFTHGEGQPSTRYDWGTELTPLIYAAIAMEDAMGTFKDVEPGSTHEGDIEWLAAVGITAGIGNGNYGPDLPVTRAQMATFIRRAVAYITKLLKGD